MQIDDDLKEAFQRTDPPAGFADRVMARIATDERVGVRRPASVWRGLAAAAALATIITGAGMYQVRERQQAERLEGLRARQEVMLALSIASEKTNLARQAVTEP